MTFEELMKDSAFVEQLNTSKDLSEVAEKLTAKGFPVTGEQLYALGNGVQAADGELDEDMLDHVAGGGIVWNILTKYLNPGYWLARALTKDAPKVCN